MSSAAQIFSKKMVAAREAKGWTQQDLAGRLGVTIQTVWTWEKGRKFCRASRLEKLANVLDRSPDWFLQESEGLPGREPAGYRGKMIAEARDDFNVSVAQLAQCLGRPPALVRGWEKGDTEPSTRDFEEAISAIENLGESWARKRRERDLEAVGYKLKAAEPVAVSGESVTLPIYWAQKLLNLYQNVSSAAPGMEKLPEELTRLAQGEKFIVL
ncbi:MAG: helix-turn-helix transcriptional regulator [Candidatus Eremiobacteraeota bacterium]|nr:helix-turn-helix transcriptional regulator [Candidatus Eremiobacteraeota bacterium]